ncbi:MAG: 4Fe-4S dicluster domain-containing protein [Acidobacteriota bacterium]
MNEKSVRGDRGRIEIAPAECKGCGLCIQACPLKCIGLSSGINAQGYHPAVYHGHGCSGCGVCFYICPEPGAIVVYREAGIAANGSPSVHADLSGSRK